MTDIKRMEKPTDLTCEKCGRPLVVKWGRHGKFNACTGYPECTFTREPDSPTVDFAEQGEEEYCENCGRPMVLKKGRFGTFFRLFGLPRLQDHQADWRHAEESRRPAGGKVPQLRQSPGGQIRPLRRIYGVQQLSHV
jgi:ssDNA-binding Zn-finger/Zn-ribbon topoisomerase 1